MSNNVLIYLHGFNSSPDSVKAQQTKQFLSTHYPHVELVMPQLALTPMAAWLQIEKLAATYKNQNVGYIGSSLGGFLATLLANKFGGNAVLINPAVTPHLLIDSLIGEYENSYTGELHCVTKTHGIELSTLQFNAIREIENFWVLLQQGDETLDYQLAVECYAGAKVTVEPLGDHGFVGFNRYLNAIVEFLFKNSL